MTSRNRRSRGAADPKALEGQAAANSQSMREAAHDMYEHPHPLNDWMNRHVNAEPIKISFIMPDPMQPRRTIPSAVRQHWNGDMATLFDVWVHAIDHERGDQGFDLAALLEARAKFPPPTDEDSKAKQVEAEAEILPPSGGPVEAALMKIINLAASIQRDGLANPITALRRGEKQFIIETGERRWMAYQLLFQQTQNSAWEVLPTRLVNDFNVWRQASENNARNDLNAIGKARQFALLLMDILSERGAHFADFDSFEYEQDFYAQVADGELYRIPKGTSELLLNTMGLKNDSQLRYCRSLLRLPNSAWVMSDDYDTPMKTLRECITQSKNDEKRLIQLIYQANLDAESVSWDTESGDTPATITRERRDELTRFTEKLAQKQNEYMKLAKKLAKGSPAEKLQFEQAVDEHIAFLRRLKQSVK